MAEHFPSFGVKGRQNLLTNIFRSRLLFQPSKLNYTCSFDVRNNGGRLVTENNWTYSVLCKTAFGRQWLAVSRRLSNDQEQKENSDNHLLPVYLFILLWSLGDVAEDDE